MNTAMKSLRQKYKQLRWQRSKALTEGQPFERNGRWYAMRRFGNQLRPVRVAAPGAGQAQPAGPLQQQVDRTPPEETTPMSQSDFHQPLSPPPPAPAARVRRPRGSRLQQLWRQWTTTGKSGPAQEMLRRLQRARPGSLPSVTAPRVAGALLALIRAGSLPHWTELNLVASALYESLLKNDGNAVAVSRQLVHDVRGIEVTWGQELDRHVPDRRARSGLDSMLAAGRAALFARDLAALVYREPQQSLAVMLRRVSTDPKPAELWLREVMAEGLGDPFTELPVKEVPHSPQGQAILRALLKRPLTAALEPGGLAVLADALEEDGAPYTVTEPLRWPGGIYRNSPAILTLRQAWGI